MLDPDSGLEPNEVDAMEDAVREVGSLLKDQKSLDNIEQHKYRMSRKKQMVEMSLKNAVETQLNGVRSGLLILQTVLQDADEISQNMKQVNEIYKTLSDNLNGHVVGLRETRVVHKEHSLLNDYLQNIYSFKDDVELALKYLKQEELLQAHEIFMKLEDCRNGIYKELALNTISSHLQERVKAFFVGLKTVNTEFEKKIKYYLETAFNCIPAGKTKKLVSTLRIIEREEKRDKIFLDNTLIEDRPKQWKKRALECIERYTSDSFDCFWHAYKEKDKDGWVLKFVQKVKTETENTLNVVYTHLQFCFPPSWNILDFYCQLYADNTHTRFLDIINKVREKRGDASSYIIVFDWASKLNRMINRYRSSRSSRNNILRPDDINNLVQYYNDQLTVELTNQTTRILEQESADRYDITKFPDEDPTDGTYYTSTPVIFYEMIHQNMEFAFKLDNKMDILPVIEQLASRIETFAIRYTEQLSEFRDRYFGLPAGEQDGMPFVEWMIAACNNAVKCSQLSEELVEKVAQNQGENQVSGIGLNFKDKSKLFVDTILKGACSHITELVLSEIKTSIFTMLFTSSWVTNKGWERCKLTIEDWDKSFFKPWIKPVGREVLLETIAEKFLTEFLVTLFNTKTIAISTKEFQVQLVDTHKDLVDFFGRTLNMRNFDVIRADLDCLPVIGDLVGQDDALLEINMANLTRGYKDVRYDQCVALLALRGDKNHKDIKDIIQRNNVKEEGDDAAIMGATPTIFSKVHRITGPLSSRFLQTIVTNKTRTAVNTSLTSAVTATTPLSKIKENMSQAISNSPVMHAITNVHARALDFSGMDAGGSSPQDRGAISADDPRQGKGPAPEPPSRRKPANKYSKLGGNPFDAVESTNPFDGEEDN